MSLLLNHPSKLCFRKPIFVRSSPLHSNGLSLSSSLPQNPPCVVMYVDPCGADLGKLVIRRAGDITPLEKKLTNEMRTIGSSNGWLTTLKDGVMSLRDIDLNPDTDSKHILLPPLETLSHCQTQIVTNVAMSSPYPEEEDCIVAVKFLGPQFSFCRPAQSNSEWINIRIKNPSFFSSHVVYSKKDNKFRIPGSGGHLIGSWDLKNHTENPPRFPNIPKFRNRTEKFHNLRFLKIPNLTKSKKTLLDSCYKSEHLVESTTTGETFMVKLYKKTVDGTAILQTEALMVFKLYDKGRAVYTQDIGDLCILLTKFESFCVPANSFPDVCPNHVKILDVNETTSVNLADQKWNC